MKPFLVDTHVWLWLATRPQRLSATVLAQLEDPARVVFLSAASTWEIAIKYRLGKLPLHEPPSLFVAPRLIRDRIQPLPVEVRHTLLVADLPDHHNDPFDRLLIAQAILDGLILVSADKRLLPYEVEIALV